MNAPEVWWSPGNTHGLDSGLIEKHQGLLYMVSASSDTTWELLDELPADAVRLVPATLNSELQVGAVPDTGQARLADDWDRYAEGIRQRLRDPYEPADPEAAAQASMYNRCATELREVLDRASASAAVSDTVQAPESPTDSTPEAGRWGSSEAETATGAVQTPDVAARPALCPTCDSSQPHLHPHRDLCPDSWHQPVPTTVDEWRTEVHRWAGLLDQIVEHDIGSDAVRRLSGDMRRALLGTDTTPGRLAWISEAGETAAVERQARYQETACARRPAEEAPDV